LASCCWRSPHRRNNFPFVLGAILYCLALLPTALSTARCPHR
jgi:hypothetical protein